MFTSHIQKKGIVDPFLSNSLSLPTMSRKQNEKQSITILTVVGAGIRLVIKKSGHY